MTTWQSGLRPRLNRSPSSEIRCPSLPPLSIWSDAIDTYLCRSTWRDDRGTITGAEARRRTGLRACHFSGLRTAFQGIALREFLRREYYFQRGNCLFPSPSPHGFPPFPSSPPPL